MIPQLFESSILMPTKTGKVPTLCKHKEKEEKPIKVPMCNIYIYYFGMKWNRITSFFS